jgi:C-terminal peptidase prc
MFIKRKTRVLAFTALVAIALFFWLEKNFLPGGSQKFPPHKSFEILASVIRYIRSDYLEEPDPRKTMTGAFQGLVNSLDILSSYLDKPAIAKYADPQKRRLKDIGVILFKRYGAFPLVVGLVENSPAEKAGVALGDYVSALDDRSILVWSLSEINLYLKDASPGPVKLRVIRDNSTKEIQVERADLYPAVLTFTPLKGTAGIAKIHHFYAPASSEFMKAVAPRVRGQKNALVLDLRDCHEGDIEEARSFMNIFLKTEQAGYFEKKGGEKEFLSCAEEAVFSTLPLVIWVNQATIGPAEMIAGVFKDLKRAKIIGLPTPGLVAKQNLFPLESGDALLLSTGVFCYASGERLWGKGVLPDVKIDLEKADIKAYTEKTLDLLSGR